MRILGVCGSLQSESSNLALLRTVPALLPAGVSFEICDLIRELPMFDPDTEALGAAPDVVAEWRRALGEADAVFIASPEYGHSLPGALKNAVDWVIGSGEFNEKVVGVTASTNAPGRGQRGIDALVLTLRAVNATIVGGVPIVRGAGDDDALAMLIGDVVGRVS